jgi:hypothetical protein
MPIVAMGRTESQIVCCPALSSASHATRQRLLKSTTTRYRSARLN